MDVRSFVSKYVRVPNYHRRSMTKDQLLDFVKSEKIYGCGTMDLSVPDHLKGEFNEFGPFIFKRDIEFKV